MYKIGCSIFAFSNILSVSTPPFFSSVLVSLFPHTIKPPTPFPPIFPSIIPVSYYPPLTALTHAPLCFISECTQGYIFTLKNL